MADRTGSQHSCEICGKAFERRWLLRRHERTVHKRDLGMRLATNNDEPEDHANSFYPFAPRVAGDDHVDAPAYEEAKEAQQYPAGEVMRLQKRNTHCVLIRYAYVYTHIFLNKHCFLYTSILLRRTSNVCISVLVLLH